MALSLEVLKSYLEESTEQLRRSEMLKVEGNDKDANALSSEWEGASAMNALYLNVDSFVRF